MLLPSPTFPPTPPAATRLFLAGDLAIGRGIDQILQNSAPPDLYEGWATDARQYVSLATAAHGPLPVRPPVPPAYPWGEALLPALDAAGVDVRLANLETALTTGGEPDGAKGIHYRAHPLNAAVCAAARLDCVSLANNHALDWGRAGGAETVAPLAGVGVRCVGAGVGPAAAAAPVTLPPRRPGAASAVVGAACDASSGVPEHWAAEGRFGVNLVPLTAAGGRAAAAPVVAAAKAEATAGRPTIAVLSMHTGGNWGYPIPPSQAAFTRAAAGAGVDVVVCHSSHHPKGFELLDTGGNGRALILHGVGDLLSDYEGIKHPASGPHEGMRDDLNLAWVVDVVPGGGGARRAQRAAVVGLSAAPFRLRHLRLEAASLEEGRWICGVLDREARALGGGGVSLDERAGVLVAHVG
jgi:poly-gamma-glutamate capsule biosynthesis protein CapA/YwtB (metallophosphatase superfamily)